MEQHNNEYIRTPEEERNELLMNEVDILAALKEAATPNVTERIEVKKQGKLLFSFRIRPLTEKEYTKCREDNTKYAKNRRFGGIRLPENTDTAGYHSSLIYTATVEEDRVLIWDNKEAWKLFNAITGTDMIDKVLYAGLKQSIIERIEEISGFNEADAEEDAKN